MRYAFIAEHRDRFGVRAMPVPRRAAQRFLCLAKSPLSERAQEDALQTELLRQAWNDSGNVYGYRKLHGTLHLEITDATSYPFF